MLCARTGHSSLFHARGFNVSELHRPLLIMRVALIIQVKSYVMNYEWMQSRNIYDKKKVQSSENILTIVCLSRELYKIKDTRYYREISRRNETLRAFPSTLFKSCSTWRRCLPELGSQDAARPVRSSDRRASCNSTWNRKRRFLPCCPRTMRSREIPERTWARSNYEVFYQQGKSKIFISPRLKTYELKRHVQYCIQNRILILLSSFLYYLKIY